MAMYSVTVERELNQSGLLEIEADNPEAAIALVQDRINAFELQTSEVNWDDPVYVPFSFATTGDAE